MARGARLPGKGDRQLLQRVAVVRIDSPQKGQCLKCSLDSPKLQKRQTIALAWTVSPQFGQCFGDIESPYWSLRKTVLAHTIMHHFCNRIRQIDVLSWLTDIAGKNGEQQ
jgi:hypothetical protein